MTGLHRDGVAPDSELLSDGRNVYESGSVWDSQQNVFDLVVSDHLGSHIRQCYFNGNTKHTLVTDAFGNTVSETGTTADKLDHAGDYGYQSDDFGLKLLGRRMYDPSTGRFISRDPIGQGGGLNVYAYCGNNPVGGVDPSGEIHVDILIGKDGLGIGREIADEGDEYIGTDGLIHEAQAGQVIRTFQVSNRPANEYYKKGPRKGKLKAKHTRIAKGKHRITGVGHEYKKGPNYLVFRSKGDPSAVSGKWLHSWGKGLKRTWKSKTLGCCRMRPETLTRICFDYEFNNRKGTKQYVEVQFSKGPVDDASDLDEIYGEY